MRKRDLRERFEEKVARSEECWLWTGSRDGDYGKIKIRSRQVGRAHRVAYELYIGPIPAGLKVLHRCDTPLCVRPEHLFLGTTADNNRDMRQKGRQRWGDNLKAIDHSKRKPRSHCKHGHEYTEANMYLYEGKRSCRTCHALREKTKRVQK